MSDVRLVQRFPAVHLFGMLIDHVNRLVQDSDQLWAVRNLIRCSRLPIHCIRIADLLPQPLHSPALWRLAHWAQGSAKLLRSSPTLLTKAAILGVRGKETLPMLTIIATAPPQFETDSHRDVSRTAAATNTMAAVPSN